MKSIKLYFIIVFLISINALCSTNYKALYAFQPFVGCGETLVVSVNTGVRLPWTMQEYARFYTASPQQIRMNPPFRVDILTTDGKLFDSEFRVVNYKFLSFFPPWRDSQGKRTDVSYGLFLNIRHVQKKAGVERRFFVFLKVYDGKIVEMFSMAQPNLNLNYVFPTSSFIVMYAPYFEAPGYQSGLANNAETLTPEQFPDIESQISSLLPVQGPLSSAELIKEAERIFLATRITFIKEELFAVQSFLVHEKNLLQGRKKVKDFLTQAEFKSLILQRTSLQSAMEADAANINGAQVFRRAEELKTKLQNEFSGTVVLGPYIDGLHLGNRRRCLFASVCLEAQGEEARFYLLDKEGNLLSKPVDNCKQFMAAQNP